MIDRRERGLFLAVSAVGFLYLVLRAILVPFIHDEARSFQVYVVTHDFLPFHAHWDAGNHLLNSALAQISYALLGPAPWALRIFSVLAYALYAWYVLRIGAWFTDRGVRWCAWLALLFTPFVIEFFALFRGYGPGFALQLMALYHLVHFMRQGGTRQMVAALAAIMLATSASLSLLLQACLFIGLTAPFLFKRSHRSSIAWITWALVGLAPLVFLGCYAMALGDRGLLYYGSDAGLLDGTLASLLWTVVGIQPRWLVLLTALLIVGLVWPAVVVLRRRSFPARDVALVSCLLLLFGELVGRWLLALAFGIHYPVDRTAMHLVPLFLLSTTLAIDHAAEHRPGWRWTAAILLWLPIRTLIIANVDRTSYWSAEAIPAEVFDLAEAKQRTMDRPLMIAGYNQNAAVWDYGNFLRANGSNIMDDAGFPQPQCDLAILDPTFFDRPPGFRTLYVSPTGYLTLIERRDPLRLSPLFDTTLTHPASSDEFITLWSPDIRPYLGKELLIDINGVVTSPVEPLTAQLVVEVKHANGEHAHYRGFGLEQRRVQWNDDTLHVALRIPPIPSDAAFAGLYFWNLHQQEMSIDRMRLGISEITP